MDRISIIVVEDNSLFRRGLVVLLEREPCLEVIADHGNRGDAFASVRKLRPDVLLMDLAVLEGEVSEGILQIRAATPSAGIVLLCGQDSEGEMFAAARAGAKGFLLRDAQVEDLLLAIKLAASNQGFISPSLAASFLNRFALLANVDSKEHQDILTDREKHILRLVARGATNREIALSLVISENTVKVHLRNIFDKLQFRNRQEAAAYAFKRHLVPITGLGAALAGSLAITHLPCFLRI